MTPSMSGNLIRTMNRFIPSLQGIKKLPRISKIRLAQYTFSVVLSFDVRKLKDLTIISAKSISFLKIYTLWIIFVYIKKN